MSRRGSATAPLVPARPLERVAIVEWAARLGAITAGALAQRARISVVSARAMLAGAERAGLLRRASPLRGSEALYTATRAGLRAGAPVPRPRKHLIKQLLSKLLGRARGYAPRVMVRRSWTTSVWP